MAVPVRLRTSVAILLAGPLLFLLGSLADFHDPYSRTAFALGVAVSAVVLIAADWVMEVGRR